MSVGHVESQKDKVADEVGRVAIRQHVGRAIKRARDTILSSPTTTSVKHSFNDSTQVVVSKEYLLKLIDRLGKDELQDRNQANSCAFFLKLMISFFIAIHKGN